jgi:hypothetical protein|tara:strand:+ start:134 stop:361 length:228 start_codon:yes stop_codon:yes gene_type:complete
MTNQIANSIKESFKRSRDWRFVAALYFDRYGETETCNTPLLVRSNGKTDRVFSAIDGYDLCSMASIYLGESIKEW